MQNNISFSKFGSYSIRKQKSKLKSIISQVKKDEMPMKSYTFIHRDYSISKKVLTMMIQENSHIMGIGIWLLIGLLVLAFVLFFIGAYAWKIHQYRSKKGHQLDGIRKRYIKGEISKDKFIKLMREL